MRSEKNAEDARLVELLGGAAEVVMEFGIDGRILFVNSAIERYLGRPVQAFAGLSFLELVVAEDHDRILSLFQKLLETGAEPLFPARLLGRDGMDVDFEISLRLFSDAHANRRIVGVLRDVTERSAEGIAAASRNAHYRALVEFGKSPAAVVAASGDVLFSNRRFKNTFGPRSNLNDFLLNMTDPFRTAIQQEWTRSVQPQGAGRGEGDVEMRLPDGSTAWFALRWERFRSDQGARQFTVTYEDITQRKKIELALRSIAAGAEAANPENRLHLMGQVAEALGLDQLIMGTLDAEHPDQLKVVEAWSTSGPLELTELELTGLPDEFVARGEVCVHPKGVSKILPAIISRVGHGFESYAGQPLHSVDGSVIGLLSGYSREPLRDLDLTRALLSAYATHAAASFDRHRADASARANKDRFDTLAHQSNDILTEIDEKGVVTFVSEAVRRTLGYAPEELVGRSCYDFAHPDDPVVFGFNPRLGVSVFTPASDAEDPLIEQPIEQAPLHSANVASPQTQQTSPDRVPADATNSVIEHRIRHANGEWRWFESRASLFTTFDDSPRALCLCRDITDRRNHDVGREMLYRVVQQGRDIVFVCERDTATLVFANQAAHLVVQSRLSKSIEGQPIAELLGPADADRLHTEILPSLSDERPWFGELSLIGCEPEEGGHEGGAEIPTEAAVFFCGADDSGKHHIAVTLRDVSERRIAEEALRESETRLGQAQKMEAVGRLAGGIAHDFNNLLTAIMGYGDLVLDEIGEGHVAHRDMGEILRAAERAGGLTRQLLAFSRRQVLQPESIDLNSVVADVDRMMRRLIGEDIELVTAQAGELRPILADPGQIEQVIVNLVVNARDAMPSGGRLEIETANISFDHSFRTDSGQLEAGQYVKLRVSDTGIGMDKDTRSQIFEPFFTTKEVNQGTGLGLATAYGIVSQTGGQIDVASSLGRGSHFTVYLPAVESEIEIDEGDSVAPSVGGTETILLVEDSDPVRHLVSRTLKKHGYTVLSTGSATGALRHCSRHTGPIDLLLSDVVLPKTPGPEIARRACAIRPGLPVLFMSGFTDDTLEMHGIDPSRETVLEKPFTPSNLLARIRSKLDRARG